MGVFESPVKVVAIGVGREVGFQGGFLKTIFRILETPQKINNHAVFVNLT